MDLVFWLFMLPLTVIYLLQWREQRRHNAAIREAIRRWLDED